MINYRKCLSSDVEEAIPLIYASGPDAFNFVFKNDKLDALGFLRFTFVSPGGEFSFDNHFAMIKNNVIIGIGSTFDYKAAKNFSLYDGFKIIKYYGWTAPSVLKRGLKIEQIIRHPKQREVIIAHIAISETERSKGYGQQLVEFLMNKSKGTDTVFALDVSEENPRAKALYSRMGFTEKEYLKSNLKSKFGYVPNHYRMEKV